MNILVAINDKFVVGCRVMLTSLFENNPGTHNIFLFYNNLKKKNIDLIRKTTDKYQSILTPIRIENNEFINKPVWDVFPIDVYYRILVYKYLPSDVDRVLWLDSDMIVNKSIEDLYNTSFVGKLICAAVNMKSGDNGNRLGLDDNSLYFNSGMVLFDLVSIRNHINDQYVEDCYRQISDTIHFPDQDLLNIMYQDKVKYVDQYKYNNQLHSELYQTKEIINHAISDSCILHYVTMYKPWITKYPFYYDGPFLKYYFKINPIRTGYLQCVHICYRIWRRLRDGEGII